MVTEPVGRFGMQRKTWLKARHPGWYQSMLLTGRLDEHLLEIDRGANVWMEILTRKMAKREGVTEALKGVNLLNLQLTEPAPDGQPAETTEDMNRGL